MDHAARWSVGPAPGESIADHVRSDTRRAARRRLLDRRVIQPNRPSRGELLLGQPGRREHVVARSERFHGGAQPRGDRDRWCGTDLCQHRRAALVDHRRRQPSELGPARLPDGGGRDRRSARSRWLLAGRQQLRARRHAPTWAVDCRRSLAQSRGQPASARARGPGAAGRRPVRDGWARGILDPRRDLPQCRRRRELDAAPAADPVPTAPRARRSGPADAWRLVRVPMVHRQGQLAAEDHYRWRLVVERTQWPPVRAGHQRARRRP